MLWKDRLLYSMPVPAQRLLFPLLSPSRYRNYSWRRQMPAGQRGSFTPFDQLRCLFVHIPKTAGISLSRALFGEIVGHHPIAVYRLIYPPETFSSYFKFGFVRNPWDRLVSTYFYLQEPGRDPLLSTFAQQTLSRFTDFDQFVRQWMPRNASRSRIHHFHPQSDWIVLRDRLALDFLGRMERIEEDYQTVARRLGITATLTHSNSSQRDRDYRAYYTEASRRVVAEVYAEDIQRFGYTF